jgi:signal peptidase
MTGRSVILARNLEALNEQVGMGTPADTVNESPQTGDVSTDHPAHAPSGRWGIAARIASWILVAAAAIVAFALVAVTVGPRVLPYQALVVRSGSMAPTIPTGSIVFYHKEPAAKVKVGDIIVFQKPGDTNEKVTHRVFKISKGATGPYFTTKGDANGAPDDWQVPAVGTGWVASFHIPTIGYVLAGLESTLGRLLLLAIPAALLGLITLYEIWRDRGRKAKAT